jgi:hypothetical protein
MGLKIKQNCQKSSVGTLVIGAFVDQPRKQPSFADWRLM